MYIYIIEYKIYMNDYNLNKFISKVITKIPQNILCLNMGHNLFFINIMIVINLNICHTSNTVFTTMHMLFKNKITLICKIFFIV